MNNTKYHQISSCNNCGSFSNEITSMGALGSIVSEAKTRCAACGFEDYWAHGFFESGAEGYDACARYINDNGELVNL